ncbi:hypothetical protein C5E45_31280 [Nocardia nova]|uniref:Uncharacterized protein n=1 Tax=Nocardia nova TaxID=37330 RepID=A0A2S6AGK4_9NOCA|nr:hypothetical protein C5E45_31280 [Nocardia nova]
MFRATGTLAESLRITAFLTRVTDRTITAAGPGWRPNESDSDISRLAADVLGVIRRHMTVEPGMRQIVSGL